MRASAGRAAAGGGARHEPDHRASRRPAHADDDEERCVQAARGICHLTAVAIDRSLPRADRGRARGGRRARRAADADRQGVFDRHRRRGRLARRAGAWRHGLSSRRPAPRSSCATRASPRSTRAPTASRRSISCSASCRSPAARRSRAKSPASGRSPPMSPRAAATASARRRSVCARPPTRWRRATAFLREALARDPDDGARGRDAVSAAVRPRARRGVPRQGRARRAVRAAASRRNSAARPRRARSLLRGKTGDRRAGAGADGAFRRRRAEVS